MSRVSLITLWFQVWKRLAQLRVQVFLWCALHGRVLTRLGLRVLFGDFYLSWEGCLKGGRAKSKVVEEWSPNVGKKLDIHRATRCKHGSARMGVVIHDGNGDIILHFTELVGI